MISGPLHSRSSVSLIMGSFLSNTARGFSSGHVPELITLSFSWVCVAAAIRSVQLAAPRHQANIIQQCSNPNARRLLSSFPSGRPGETLPDKRRLLSRTCRGTRAPAAATPSGLHFFSPASRRPRGFIFKPAAAVAGRLACQHQLLLMLDLWFGDKGRQ